MPILRGGIRGPGRPRLGLQTDESESHWRRAQRQRRSRARRRLTLRGRLTLAAVAALPVALLAAWTGAHRGPDVEEPSPPVSAAAPPPPESPVSPAEILTRLPVTRDALELPATAPGPAGETEGGHLYERVDVSGAHPRLASPLRVEYTLDAELTRQVFTVLERGRVALGHVILLDPETGRVLSYASTDSEQFPATRPYPAASLVKIITAAAALDSDPQTARLPCRFQGSPYRLTRSRIDPPRRGREVTLGRALATSNNQCFAQLAVHAVGAKRLVDAISRFGWLAEPAPAHASGTVEVGEDRYAVGRLGCGLAGCRITPLHAAQLAATLARGELIAPRWIDRVVDARSHELPLPAVATPRRVMTRELADELRAMLVETTRSGTARSAFRKRNGRPRLGPVRVAGKTGSLSGREPKGRYEWFAGVAPADAPRIAVAVLLVQGDLWWRNASQIAGDVLERVFCEGRSCRPELAERWLGGRAPEPAGAASAALP